MAYFAASCDEDDVNKDFARQLKLDYPILSDTSKKVAKAYGVIHKGRTVPERWTFYIGKNGKLLYIDINVQPSSHGADVVARLRNLGVDTMNKKKQKN